MVCYDFYKRSGVRCSPQGRNSGQKKRIDLTLRKTLTPRSSESGFHRNVKFATFEEAGRLCNHTSKRGKVAPLGGQERPKVAPLTFYGVGRPMKWPSNHPEHPSNRLATPSNHPEHPSNPPSNNPSNRLATGVVFLPLQAPFHIFFWKCTF